jgi:biotin carboxyl carrier protein
VATRLRVCQKDAERLSVLNIRSERSGIVWESTPPWGVRVSEGDRLVVLVSMNIQFLIAAPFFGVIQSILVSEGSTVLVVSR